MTGAAAIAALATGTLLTGCGLEAMEPPRGPDPGERPAVKAPTTTPMPADPSPEPPGAGNASGASTAERAASEYARAFTNWTWRDVATTTAGTLAALSAGDLRERNLAGAKDLRDTRVFEREKATSRGVQLAIDVQRGRTQRRVWIVMRQKASATGRHGRENARIRVYLATVRRLTNGHWYVVGFRSET